jgi:AcrR family transcriptional regulator
MARLKSLRFDDIRASILDAAASLFATKGFRNTNIIDIGQACRASKSRMYHYFTSKEAMLDEMLVQHVATLVEQATPVAEAPGDPRARLQAFVLLHLRTYHESRDRHTVLVEDAEHLSHEARAQVRRLEQQLVDLLEGLLHAINPQRFADRPSAATHAMLIFGMLNWTYTWYRPSGRLSLQALAEQATALCLEGVESGPAGMSPAKAGAGSPAAPPSAPHTAAPRRAKSIPSTRSPR